jgi:hypothetical protein
VPDVFDQIAAEQAPAPAQRPAAGPGRGGRAPDVFDQIHAEKQQEGAGFHPLDAAANAISNWWDQVHHGPLNLYDVGKGLVGLGTGETEHAMADENVALWQKVKDAYNRGDPAVAVHALNYVLNGIPGLSLGTHLDRAGEKFKAGDISGGIGDTLGTATNLLTLAKSPEVADAVVENGPRAAEAAREAVKAGGPDVAKGAGTAAASAAIAHYLPYGSSINYAAGMGELKGATQAVRGLMKGFEAGKNAWADNLAQRMARDRGAAKAAASSAAAAEPGPAPWEPGPSGTPAPPAQWEPYTPSTWEPGPPLKAGHIEQYDAAAKPEAQPATGDVFDQIHAEATGTPDARETLPPDLAARVEQLRAETHSPEELERARLADWIGTRQAHNDMTALDNEWTARAAKADHIAEFVLRHNLEQTPAMYAKVADELGYDKAPSEDAQAMIADRIDWFRARHPALTPAEAAPAASIGQMDPRAVSAAAPADLETQLRDSLAARGVNLESGRPQESQAPQPAPGSGTNVDTAGTGGRPAIAAPDRTGAGAQGERTAVDIPGEQRAYPATYSVRELADIQPSHLGDTFQPNPDYGYKNDRNYDDPRNQRKIIDWSTKQGFNPRNLLNTAPTSEIGPPVVDDAGNVLGGNGRSMIIQRVYRSNPEGAAAYRAELDRTAAHYGIDPESYAHMKEPVLVRTLDPAILKDEASAQRAITDFNKVGTAALTPAEQAIADSRGVSLRTLDDIAARMDKEGPDATLVQTLDGRAGLDVMENLTRDGVISPQEHAKLSTGSKLTKAGKDRISGLMLGRFFTDAKQLDSLSDSMRNKMERIAAPLARIEGIPEYSLAGHMREGLALLEDADAHGAATLDDYLAQQGLFSSHEYAPEAIALARALKTRNPVALTNAVRAYATRAKYAKEFQGEGMFGDIPTPLKPGAAFAESFGQ